MHEIEVCSHPHIYHFLSLFHVEHLLYIFLPTAAPEHGSRGAHDHSFARPSILVVDHLGNPINGARKFARISVASTMLRDNGAARLATSSRVATTKVVGSYMT